jgi:hypothetical protein
VFEFFCQGYFGKSNVLTKSDFTITNWNPIVKKIYCGGNVSSVCILTDYLLRNPDELILCAFSSGLCTGMPVEKMLPFAAQVVRRRISVGIMYIG